IARVPTEERHAIRRTFYGQNSVGLAGISLYTRPVSPPLDRRDFLGFLASGVAGLCVSSKALAAERSPIIASRLSNNLIEFSGAGANVVAVTGGDGVVLINGGLKERSEDLLQLVAAETRSQRIQSLTDMDWHPRCTG